MRGTNVLPWDVLEALRPLRAGWRSEAGAKEKPEIFPARCTVGGCMQGGPRARNVLEALLAVAHVRQCSVGAGASAPQRFETGSVRRWRWRRIGAFGACAARAEAGKRGMDHDALRDMCRQNYGIHSMGELNEVQLMQTAQDLVPARHYGGG